MSPMLRSYGIGATQSDVISGTCTIRYVVIKVEERESYGGGGADRKE